MIPKGRYCIVSVIYCLLILTLNGCESSRSKSLNVKTSIQVNGVSFVGPPREYTNDPFTYVKNINANWAALMPYAFCDPNRPEIKYDVQQWWGETSQGIIKQIIDAKSVGLKIMLKPHVWVKGQGWNGDFRCETSDHWELWEKSYSKYILDYAELADSLNVEMFCIGLEFRQVTKLRPDFWERLIAEVRIKYHGPITYAANWDNYQNINFWDKVDYIGINAYFPLDNKKSSNLKKLKSSWEDITEDLEEVHKEYDKVIILTEFGYRSIDGAAGNQWEIPDNYRNYNGQANLQIQSTAYQALFETIWDKPWCGGGFLWKWYADHENAGGKTNNDYTPQNKPVESIIRTHFK